MITVEIRDYTFSSYEILEFKVPSELAPMYDNKPWEDVIEEYLSYDYTVAEIKELIKKDYERLRVDNLEMLLD